MWIWFLCTLMLLLGFSAQPLGARVVDDLYRAQTIVTGTEEPERTRGFRETFETVVAKLTGDTRLMSDPRIRALAATPHRFVEAFEYEDRMKDIPIHDEQGTRERPHFLRVTFSRTAIDDALQHLGIAKWSADRPVVAVWLGIETAGGRFVLTDSGPEGYGQRAVLTETASRLGLPIALPPASRSTIAFDAVANERISILRAAIPQADVHLVGRLTVRDDGYWDIAWSFHAPRGVHQWSLSRVTFDRALKQGLANVAGTLSGSTLR
jgi:hypothetical protein